MGYRIADQGIQLSVTSEDGNNISMLPRSGSFVRVNWEGVPWFAEPFEYLIGAWLEDENTTETAPIKFHFIAPDIMNARHTKRAFQAHAAQSSSSSRNATAPESLLAFQRRKGSVKFYVLNLRKAVVFKMMRGWGPARQLVAASTPITFANLQGEPTNGHLAIHTGGGEGGGGGGEGGGGGGHANKKAADLPECVESVCSAVTVHWSTGVGVEGGGWAQRVQFGLAAGQLTREALASRVETYSRDDMCGGVAAGMSIITSSLRPHTLLAEGIIY
jgi:hypothetical protein